MIHVYGESQPPTIRYDPGRSARPYTGRDADRVRERNKSRNIRVE